MIKFDVLNRFTGEIEFTAEIDCEENDRWSLKSGLALKWALRNGIDIVNTNFKYANLDNDNLGGVSFIHSDFAHTSFDNANLMYANFSDVSFEYADFRGANLEGVDFGYSVLRYVNFAHANLENAKFQFADLRGANFAGAKNAPLIIYALHWPVIITRNHMQIGCEYHSIAAWQNFGDRSISAMGRLRALKFWRAHKEMLLSLAKAHQKNFTQENEGAAA